MFTRLAVLLLLLSAAAHSSVTEQEVLLTRFAPPWTKIVLGVEWQRITSSPWGLELKQEIKAAGMPADPALEMLDSLRRIVVFAPDGSPPKTAKKSSRSTQTPALVIMKGRFPREKVRQMALAEGARVAQWGSFEVFTRPSANGPAASTGAMVQWDEETLLMGDIGTLRAALTAPSTENATSSCGLPCTRAAELANTYDAWMVAEADLTEFAGERVPQAEMFRDIERIEAGLSLRQGLTLNLNLAARSSDSAQQLAAGLQLMTGMLAAAENQATKQQKNPSPARQWVKNIRIGSEGPLVNLGFTLSDQELQQGMAQFRAGVIPAVKDALSGGPGSSRSFSALMAPPSKARESEPQSFPLLPRFAPEESDTSMRVYGSKGGTVVLK
jgi:hypothetical protein